MNRLAVLLFATAAVAGTVGSASAADLVIDAPATPDVASGDWDGLFIGTFGGYAKGAADLPVDFDLDGWLLGVNAGVNFTLTQGIVAGVVGDLAWSNITDADVFAPPGAYDINWTGSVRGRVGYDAGAFLPYLTAGFSFANATLTADTGDEVDTNTHFGWTGGAGVEFKATDSLSVDLAYRYSQYVAAPYGTSETDWRFATHQVTAGLNWHF